MFELLLTTALDHNDTIMEPKVLLRSASIYQSGTYATAIGGFLEVKTPAYHHFHSQVRISTSQLLPTFSGINSQLNQDFVSSNLTSYSNLNIANITYSTQDLIISIGRIELDTPYADSDDIRMTANSFEGFTSKWSVSDTAVLQFFGANSMSGIDATAQEKFSKLSSNSAGFLALSGEFELGSEHKISLWNYYTDGVANFFYTTYDYSISFETGATLLATLEFANMQELSNSGVAGTVFGVVTEASHKGYTVGVNYEHLLATPSKSISDGFGGGPYKTAMDETTLAFVSQNAVGFDIDAISLSISKELATIDVGYKIGYFKALGSNVTTLDNDITVGWNFEKNWKLEGTLVHLDTVLANGSTTINRALVRVDYSLN